MKIQATLLSAALLVLVMGVGNAASAEDCKIKEGAKKVGTAMVWPFKAMGKGLKAMGNGAKKMVGKGS